MKSMRSITALILKSKVMVSAKDDNNLYFVKDSKKKTVYDYTMEYLGTKYDIMYNEISHDFQIALKGSREWQYLNLNSLIIELAKAGVDIPTGKLEILIRSEWIPKYNPIKEYFNNLPIWDGEDHILKLASYVPTHEKKSFNYHFKKWLVRAIRCALEPNYFNKRSACTNNFWKSRYSHRSPQRLALLCWLS